MTASSKPRWYFTPGRYWGSFGYYVFDRETSEHPIALARDTIIANKLVTALSTMYPGLTAIEGSDFLGPGA